RWRCYCKQLLDAISSRHCAIQRNPTSYHRNYSHGSCISCWISNRFLERYRGVAYAMEARQYFQSTKNKNRTRANKRVEKSNGNGKILGGLSHFEKLKSMTPFIAELIGTAMLI